MVKALFPIGKTQWSKWNDDQRNAFNALRQQGKSFEAAVKYINSPGFADIDGPEPKKKSIFDVIEDAVEDVADVAATVGSVAAAVSPVVAVAKTVAKVTKKKGK